MGNIAVLKVDVIKGLMEISAINHSKPGLTSNDTMQINSDLN